MAASAPHFPTVGPSVRLALFQPDIPQNTGTIIRLCACLDVALDIIEPAGFDTSDRNLRRSGMDYLERAAVTRHPSWEAFEAWRRADNRRLVLATVRAHHSHIAFPFSDRDILLMGRESAGVPDSVRDAAEAQVKIAMREGLRSLNVAISAAILLGEALRQTGGFPLPPTGATSLVP
ncbi:MAG: tRNA (cytidine(34)-2'-O)-methyltransferase [Beijerinckiaceae bacterium]